VVAQRTDLCGVVTQPDRPAGRGHKLRPTPVKAAALELGIPVFEPQSLGAFAQEHAGEVYDLFALASYGKILPQRILDMPKLGALNVHPSLLPKYRGATPIQTALLEGDTETGVTIMLMDAGMDTGDIVLQERTPIDPDERYGELHDRLSRFGAQALSHAIDLARSGHIPHLAQSGKPSVTRPISKDDLAIEWSWPSARIVNVIRAFAPVPAARAVIAGTPVKLLRARTGAPTIAPLAPGEIVATAGDAVTIRTGDGTVDVLELVPPNRGSQSGAAFAQALSAKTR
jgi:methionyl-tRNA formyltransferase